MELKEIFVYLDKWLIPDLNTLERNVTTLPQGGCSGPMAQTILSASILLAIPLGLPSPLTTSLAFGKLDSTVDFCGKTRFLP